MSDLCQLQDVKSYIGQNNTRSDTVLQSLISNASAFIERYCSRTFAQADYSETRNGTGGYRMPMKQAPITAVSSVSVNDLAVPAAVNGTSYGYVWDSEIIYIRPGAPPSQLPWAFSLGIQNVVIDYTAGYSMIPLDVAQACIELVASKFAKRDRIDKKNEILAQQTVGFDISSMPQSVVCALAQYRRWGQ
ncbi:MAG: phage head-tail connector protein [Gammaproteobacteria bacterium]